MSPIALYIPDLVVRMQARENHLAQFHRPLASEAKIQIGNSNIDKVSTSEGMYLLSSSVDSKANVASGLSMALRTKLMDWQMAIRVRSLRTQRMRLVSTLKGLDD